jgi:glyoxylase-like metal-dependent hydrolase (beta-lactamase superfamily II)
VIARLAEGLAVVCAPNPGPMTGPGTNQYLLGGGGGVQIDAAPLDAENRRRLAQAPARTERLVLTHIHPDHVGGAADLGVPIAVHASRATAAPGGRPLAPATTLEDGDEIRYPGGRLLVVHTPGHESGHCCFYEPDRRWLFTGDTVLSTGTSMIAPPDGDMIAYLASLRRLRALELAAIFPGHGPPVSDPAGLLDEYLAHRLMRERQILDALEDGPAAVDVLVPRLYTGLDPALTWAAALTVQAHLAKLEVEGAVVAEPAAGGRFRLA